jgi:hypothetical protein
MSCRSVSDIQTRAEGESLYIRYRSDANTMNSIVNMLLQHCSTVTTWNNMVDNLFIVGRTTLFTPVDINLEQPVRF